MQEKTADLSTPVRYLKGVGPKKSQAMSRLGINTVGQLLCFVPSRYEDRSKIARVSDLKPGQNAAIRGKVTSASSRMSRSGAFVFQALISDGSGAVNAVWFNQPYLKDHIIKDSEMFLYGRVELYDRLQIVQPEYEMLKGDSSDSINTGRIVPVYHLTEGITQRYLRILIHGALSSHARLLRESLPTYIIARQKLVDIKFAVNNMHFPISEDAAQKAYRRMVFGEFFMLQLALAMKRNRRPHSDVSAPSISDRPLESFKKLLPFELTQGQLKAMDDIDRDMSSQRPMNRLLEGDVGSGKTAVAAYALLSAVKNGMQGALMAPTEVLARQHFIGLSELLMPSGVNVGMVVGGMDDASRSKLLTELSDGTVDVVVGTHALIQDDVKFGRLGLAIIDEQHKFGVSQKSLLKNKGPNPHVLVMTATPIPRTLAMTVYGDLDISVIKHAPKGRKPVTTYVVEDQKRSSAYGFIREELAKGRQAYIICPLVEKVAGGKIRASGAIDTFEALKNEVFAGYEVGLLHGRMDAKEKDAVMKDFKKAKIKVLVSTVVIEVGIDVPNATVMLVENADRFGLAQLHQLRGRVGRGEHDSYCILLADPSTEVAARRLGKIEQTTDGFSIAEEDLDIRGPGEVFGTKQHGLPEIKFGNIIKDVGIMESARREAFAVVSRDPGLKEEHHVKLKSELITMFGQRSGFAGIA